APVQSQGIAKVEERPGIARGQFLHLTPSAAEIGKDVGRAGSGMAIDGGEVGTDEGVVLTDGNGFTEAVARGTVARGQLLGLRPGATRFCEDVDSAARAGSADGCDGRSGDISRT